MIMPSLKNPAASVEITNSLCSSLNLFSRCFRTNRSPSPLAKTGCLVRTDIPGKTESELKIVRTFDE